MPSLETIRRIRNKDTTGPDMKDFDSGNIGPVAPNHPDAGKYGAYLKGRNDKKNQNNRADKGKDDSSIKKVGVLISGAQEVLGIMQKANAASKRGLGDLNTGKYSSIRDEGTKGYEGQSAIISGEDKEYQAAKAKIDKKDKKNGY